MGKLIDCNIPLKYIESVSVNVDISGLGIWSLQALHFLTYRCLFDFYYQCVTDTDGLLEHTVRNDLFIRVCIL